MSNVKRNSMHRRTLLLALAALMPVPVQAQAPTPPTTAPVRLGDLVIEGTWMRQPPDGARVAGGFMRITNAGTAPDRLISGSASFSKRFELHEMAVTDGVMRMRELANGIEIKPGQTVELKPGGLHVMYMDLTEQPKAGQVRKTTLVFEKAGKVEIDVVIMPLGNRAPAKGHGHH